METILPSRTVQLATATDRDAFYAASRFVLNTLRGVNELVFALLFVSAVGLGPFPGILALALVGRQGLRAVRHVDGGRAGFLR
jgi:phosphonate transport system permease protein